MSVRSVTLLGQRAAAQLREDQGVLKRLGPPGTPDPVTGVITPTHTVIYTGPGRVKPMGRVTANNVSAGEARDSQMVYVVSLPITVTDARPGDVWVTTSSHDPEAASRVLRVVEVEAGSQITARRLTCELVERRQP